MNRNDTGTNRTSLKRPGSKSLFWSAAALAAVLVCAAPFFRNVHALNGADPAAELRTDAPKQRRECPEALGRVNGRSEREHESDVGKGALLTRDSFTRRWHILVGRDP